MGGGRKEFEKYYQPPQNHDYLLLICSYSSYDIFDFDQISEMRMNL